MNKRWKPSVTVAAIIDPSKAPAVKPGDVIVEFNGKKVTDSRHLRLMVGQTAPGTSVGVKALRDGKEQTFTIESSGQLTNAAAFQSLIVAYREGAPVRLGDVAEVKIGHPAPIGDAVINDGDGVLLIVEKQPWGNTLDVTKGVEKMLEELKPTPIVQLNAAIACAYAEGPAAGLARLEALRVTAMKAYAAAATSLTAARQKAALSLAGSVTRRVRELGMPNAEFVVAVEPISRDKPSAQGADFVRFDFSANPGQPPRPLAKVASGGELSRISLALQVSLLSEEGAATMIFDEVDAGIGGVTADVVGQQLAALEQSADSIFAD